MDFSSNLPVDASDQSTADTGPAADASPASPTRQQRFRSSPFEAPRGPLLELPAPLYARRSRSEDQSPAWPPDFHSSSWSHDLQQQQQVDKQLPDAVASILNSPAFLLALSQLEHEPEHETACPAAEILASLIPALEQQAASEDYVAVPPTRRHGWYNEYTSKGDTDDQAPPAWSADQSALLPPGLLSASDWSAMRNQWAGPQLLNPPPSPPNDQVRRQNQTHGGGGRNEGSSPPNSTSSARRGGGGNWRRKQGPAPPPPSSEYCWQTEIAPGDEYITATGTSTPSTATGTSTSTNNYHHHQRQAGANHVVSAAPEKSKLLQEFRAGQTSIASLYVLKNQMVEFALDQSGARFIQQRLSACPPQEAQYARDILLPRTKMLVTDVFGNHIVQRLLETGTPLQKHEIYLQLKGDILRLALQTYGCRVLQKALETLSLEDKLAFASELQAHVVRCVEDQNGNHVIQKCIERLPAHEIQFIIDAFRGQVARVSAHCYGCRVIQRVLEHCPVERIYHLLDEIMDRLVRLAQDQYGNYVVQHVLRYGRLEDRQAIVDRIAHDLLLMSSHKFSSNVVEKCLELRATPDARRKIIGAAFGDPADPRPPIMQMVRDRYANYVVQRMLDVTSQEDAEGLVDEVVGKLERHMPALRKFTYGKHIAAALERLRKQKDDASSHQRRDDARGEDALLTTDSSAASSSIASPFW